MTKVKTEAAKGAALIRAELKKSFPGIKFRVTSENYSGGSAINVYMTDVKPAIAEQVKSIASKFQYGHFDAMTDCYEYSNSKSDLPQAKYVFVNNELSAELKSEIEAYIMSKYDSSFYEGHRELGDMVYQLFRGRCESFWESKEKEAA